LQYVRRTCQKVKVHILFKYYTPIATFNIQYGVIASILYSSSISFKKVNLCITCSCLLFRSLVLKLSYFLLSYNSFFVKFLLNEEQNLSNFSKKNYYPITLLIISNKGIEIKYLNLNIFRTRCCKPLIFQTQIILSNRIHSLKYLRSATFSSKDIVIRK